MDASQTSPRSPRLSGTRTYNSWLFMIRQCSNPAARDYARYGGRGIVVCERWLDFRNFLADLGEKPEGRIFSRIDKDGNFEPGNCRWATPEERRTLKGYRMAEVPGHPLAGKNGLIMVHRKVLYDRIGPGWHHCHWCGELVEWRARATPGNGALVVDHVDHDRLNNAPENLVPSCNSCNVRRRRGVTWEPWIPGTPVAAVVAQRRAKCVNGHLLTDDNVYIRPDTGQRQCLACKTAVHKAQWAAKTPAEREAARVRAASRVPCPVCGDLKAYGGMRAHVRTTHDR